MIPMLRLELFDPVWIGDGHIEDLDLGLQTFDKYAFTATLESTVAFTLM